MSNAESSKILAGIAVVLMIGYYIFKMELLLHIVLALLVLAAFPTRVSVFLAKNWIKFSDAIGYVNSRVILTLIYFVVLVPLSVLYKRFNREILAYFRGDKRDSYFLGPDRIYTKEMFEKIW